MGDCSATMTGPPRHTPEGKSSKLHPYPSYQFPSIIPRFTPTRAGTTGGHKTRPYSRTVHPHARGGHERAAIPLWR